ncbi:YaaC family protein [Aquibacillus salsiterrae]|uniref:YaaC family protein n=1 Tax=Aquibacillus salsiterrae TaxID=2950439 RepID=A0A9X3WHZ6_9BACI|nr:YaaC family protein [Aquibacillus salsiterrae]MDC3417739.1 YaaC family protein [Aquibacillus salsiterrae]
MIKKKIFDFLQYLSSVHTSQKFLESCYQKQEMDDVNLNSYENSYRFLYYLQHGLQFYQAGQASMMTVKPIMYFYGMVHLLKACLLTCRPQYPENTSMLAHGVSTRKRKKQQYSFLQDEVKVQHKGLFPYICKHLYHFEQLSFEKTNMDQLLATIPELNSLYQFHRGKDVLVPVSHYQAEQIVLPYQLLDDYHLTENNFIAKLSNCLPTIKQTVQKNGHLELFLDEPLSPSSKGPFYFHLKEQTFYFPAKRHLFSTSNEVMNHYLLLYNLSMICRYETEWWGDLLHTLPTEDYPFIKQFLDVTATKIPFLLGLFLYQQKND